MEAIAANLQVRVVFHGHAVEEATGRHGLVEGGVEDGDHRDPFAEDLLAGLHGDGLRRVVQRAEILEFDADVLDDLVRDQRGGLVLFGAVEHAVSDGLDLADVADDLVFPGGQQLDELDEGLFMRREIDVVFGCPTGLGFMADVSAEADSLAEALRDDLFGLHLDQLILQRGASGVDDQYFHFPNLQIINPTLFG